MKKANRDYRDGDYRFSIYCTNEKYIRSARLQTKKEFEGNELKTDRYHVELFRGIIPQIDAHCSVCKEKANTLGDIIHFSCSMTPVCTDCFNKNPFEISSTASSFIITNKKVEDDFKKIINELEEEDK